MMNGVSASRINFCFGSRFYNDVLRREVDANGAGDDGVSFAVLVRLIAAASGYIVYSVGKPKIDTILRILRLSVLWPF